MSNYGITDIVLWSGSGYLAGHIIASIIASISLTNSSCNINKLAFGYGMVGLIAGGVRGYTGKTIVELIMCS